ncbi:MAG: UDP-glucuronic acid decarboxylase family protein [Bacteroidales bacterium]
MKKILVAGGAGFLGSNLCRKILHDFSDVEIICVDNFYTGTMKNIVDMLGDPRFEFKKGDINELDSLNFNIDEIYNFACPASPPHYQNDPIYTMKTNVVGVINLLELARKCNARILQSSTSEVYGNPTINVQSENYSGNVNCTGIRACYDEGKRSAEALMFDFHRLYNVNIKVVRIFNTYGEYMRCDDGRVVSNFIVQCLSNQNITIYGDGMQTRSLCYVDDLLDGIIKMMQSNDMIIGPINLGNPEEYTINEIAKKIIRLTRANSKIVYCPLPSDDPRCRKPDISLAKGALNWYPTISLEVGLLKTIDWFKTQMEMI